MHVFIVACTIFQKLVTFCSVRDDFRTGYSSPMQQALIEGKDQVCLRNINRFNGNYNFRIYTTLKTTNYGEVYPKKVGWLHLSIPEDYFERHPVSNKFLPHMGNVLDTANPVTAWFVLDIVSSKAEWCSVLAYINDLPSTWSRYEDRTERQHRFSKKKN